jgi:hypothetical protein
MLPLLACCRGFRLLAMPILPIVAGSPPAYGSADAGKHVHTDNAVLNGLMEKAAARLHLKKHTVAGVAELCSAGDVEGHVGLDGRYYLLDLARTFPPEAGEVAVHLPQMNQSVFFRMLRPEYLQVCAALCLCADRPNALDSELTCCRA